MCSIIPKYLGEKIWRLSGDVVLLKYLGERGNVRAGQWGNRRSQTRRGETKRGSADGVGSGERRSSPLHYDSLEAMPPKNFSDKTTLKLHIVMHFRTVVAQAQWIGAR